MAYVFLDTNAFLKLYQPEKGSTWLHAFVSGKQVGISELAIVECATTLGRLYRDGLYSKRQASSLFAQIHNERYKYEILPLDFPQQLNRVVSLAFNLPTTLRLRALDGIHLATASIAFEAANKLTPPVPFTFVSSDLQLLRVAQTQSFPVENPESYP